MGSTSAPTGQVFNPTSTNFGGAVFMFATEDGTISSWMGGTAAAIHVNLSASNAVFKGLALANNGSAAQLYATDFHNAQVDVFDTNFNPVSLGSGAFTDPSLPSGYAPFGIQQFGGKLYISYALQDAAKHDDVAGAGHGFVDVFNPDGTFVQRLITMGSLNSPWGMTWAPSGFGKFGGDMLVGNFGDGTINVFDPTTGKWLAALDDQSGNPIVNQGLWGITFGNGAKAGSTNILYFTAGIPGPGGMVEDNGLFGQINSAPEPGTLTLLGSSFISLIGYGLRRAKRRNA
jgi:uncharacterized protein (TIGR03118 family)